MKLVPVETTRLTVPDLLKLAKGQTVVLTRKGKPLAGVKDLSGSDWEAVALANNSRFQALIDASRRSYAEQGGIPLEALREELGLRLPAHRRRRPKKP